MAAKIELEYIQKGVEQVKKDLSEINSKVAEAKKNKVSVEFETTEINKYKNDLQSLINMNSGIREAMKSVATGGEAWKALNRESQKCYRSIAQVKNALIECGDDGAKAIVETINANQKFQQSIQKSERASEMHAEKFKKQEKEKQQAIKQTENEMKRMEQLLGEMQSLSRMMSDQENAGKTGKKGKTSYDIAWAIKQYKTLSAEAENLAKILGEDNEAVQHFRNGMAWTEKNNPIRALRDEATKLIPKIAQAEAELKKLNIDPTKNSKQIENTTKHLDDMRTRYQEIIDQFQKSIDDIKMDDTGIFDDGDVARIQQTVDLLKEQLRTLTQIKTSKQEAVTSDKLNEQQYKELKKHIQEIYSLEEKIAQLEKTKGEKDPQVKAMKEVLAAKKSEYQIEGQIAKLEGNRKTEIQQMTNAHKESLKVIEAQKSAASELGDKFKNMVTYIGAYKLLGSLEQSVQKAIDTMKELDTAFTDIQMVTMGTKEETNQLAQEYNGLAKSLGATTTEVAEGAGEWLRQGKSAEETTKLLTASMTLSKVGAIESSQATELLTSSLNGYKIEAENAMSIVDKISAIDLEAATSSEELATALARTANIANDSSVSFDKLLAMIGTVSSVTRRSASTIRRSI